MKFFRDLRRANAARQAEWDPNDRITAAFRGNELAGEVGEALERVLEATLAGSLAGKASNTIKKLERERLGIAGSRSSVEQLAEELADVVTCADLIAMGFNIDLTAAIAQKFNATSERMGLQTRLGATPLGGYPRAPKGWIGVDLDGTLAYYDTWRGIEHIGEPVPKMLERVLEWVDAGHTVRIMTARWCVVDGRPEVQRVIHAWLIKHGLPPLDITNEKDFNMVALWDDRCVQVAENEGVPIVSWGPSSIPPHTEIKR